MSDETAPAWVEVVPNYWRLVIDGWECVVVIDIDTRTYTANALRSSNQWHIEQIRGLPTPEDAQYAAMTSLYLYLSKTRMIVAELLKMGIVK